MLCIARRGRRIAEYRPLYVAQRKSRTAAAGHDQTGIAIQFDAGGPMLLEQPQQMSPLRGLAKPQLGFPATLREEDSATVAADLGVARCEIALLRGVSSYPSG